MIPDEYRVRAYRTHRRWLFGRPVGREVWAVEIDYLSCWGEHGDQVIARHWIDADDVECAVSLGISQIRELRTHATTCRTCRTDPTDALAPLVVRAGGRVVIDERS